MDRLGVDSLILHLISCIWFEIFLYLVIIDTRENLFAYLIAFLTVFS